MKDEQKRKDYLNFLHRLKAEDPDSFTKRHDDEEPHTILDIASKECVLFFAYHKNKVMGCADYSKSEMHKKGL